MGLGGGPYHVDACVNELVGATVRWLNELIGAVV
jgi:hypothetical protein